MNGVYFNGSLVFIVVIVIDYTLVEGSVRGIVSIDLRFAIMSTVILPQARRLAYGKGADSGET